MTYNPAPPAERAARNRPSWVIPAAAGAAGLVLGVLGTVGVQAIIASVPKPKPTAEADTRFIDAYHACASPTGVELADEDRTLTIDSKGKEDYSGTDVEHLFCILEQLDAPTRVTTHIGQTTSMDGRQTASWDGITVEWSYHPNRGSDMVLTLDEDEG